jgi:cellulose synthase/poly-beta-1,6-N-acetylglucosamine synthase-like glycosyltransferase
MMALGVLVPCHNEAAVLHRRLVNLALCAWPAASPARPHQLVLVDDGSDDDTAAQARALCATLFPASGPVRARVVPNAVRPGKAGAIQQGLAALEGLADIIVLTDADVAVRPESLRALAEAFAARPELGMACGRQEFVRDLCADGSCRSAAGGEPVPAADIYDRATAAVRAWESRRGRLFSVHGQLLAWRSELGLEPSPGFAADDLDLMFQVRERSLPGERGPRIELIPGAAFLEVKTSQQQARAAQELRRARAYVQALAGRRSRPGATLFERCQLAFYRRAPLAAPLFVSGWIVPLLAGVAALLIWLAGSAGSMAALLLTLVPLAVLLALPVLALATARGRQLVHLLQVIRVAKRLERQAPQGDRWEMARQ